MIIIEVFVYKLIVFGSRSEKRRSFIHFKTKIPHMDTPDFSIYICRMVRSGL